MGIREWQHLRCQLTLELPVEYEAYHPGVDAVEAAAEQFEVTTGYKLPPSYKAFAQVFGPGEMGDYYRICIPGDEKCGYDLTTGHNLAREAYSPAEPCEQGKILDRLLYFASTIGGEFVGWDPLDMTDPINPEYRVYYVTRLGTARAVASSFPEFVTEICLKDRLHEFFGWQNKNPLDWRPAQTFFPYSRIRLFPRAVEPNETLS